MQKGRAAVASVALATMVATMLPSPASARDGHFPGPFFPLVAAGAVVAGIATLITAPIVFATAPLRAPAYYYPPPGPNYYAAPPAYYPPPPPAYYPQPQAYYPPPQPPAYYAPPSAYYPPPPPGYPPPQAYPAPRAYPPG
jgi:hypothetical protein